MRKLLVLAVFGILFNNKLIAQNPAWLVKNQIIHEGAYKDIVDTEDGNWLIGGDVYGVNYDLDFLLRKVSYSGDILWEFSYGGNGDEKLKKVIAASGGYWLIGTTDSDASGDISTPAMGEGDVWIVKVDLSGTLIWEKRYGDISIDEANDAIGLSNDNLVVGGSTRLYDGQNYYSHFWLFQLNPDGEVVWEHTSYGGDDGKGFEHAISDLIPDADGGFVAAGIDEQVTDRGDDWVSITGFPTIIKFDSQGDISWSERYDHTVYDVHPLITKVSDGKLIMTLPGSVCHEECQDGLLIIKTSSSGEFLEEEIFEIGEGLIWDRGYNESLLSTSDGGFLLVTQTESSFSDEIKDFNRGSYDALLAKFDATLQLEWSKFLGSVQQDRIGSIIKDANGDYIMVGSGYDEYSAGGDDFWSNPAWIISMDGSIDNAAPEAPANFIKNKLTPCQVVFTWEKSIDNLSPYGYVLMLDEEVVYVGTDTTATLALDEGTNYDAELYAFDLSLNISSSQSMIFTTPQNIQEYLTFQGVYGTFGNDDAIAMALDDSGGIIVAGQRGVSEDSNGSFLSPGKGGKDALVTSFDSHGNLQWDLAFGGSNFDSFSDMEILNDGIIFGGYTYSNDISGVPDTARGVADFYWVKTDKEGATLLQRRYGGTGYDILQAVAQVDDGYILAGNSNSPASGDVETESFGNFDMLVYKVDENGDKVWETRIGGTGTDVVNDILVYPTGEILVLGGTDSNISGNITAASKGYGDIIAVLLDGSGNIQEQWRYGGASSYTYASKLIKGFNGSIIIGGTTSDEGNDIALPGFGDADYWVLAIDVFGNKVGEMRFGGAGSENLQDIALTPEGGLAIIGTSTSGKGGQKTEDNYGKSDAWLVYADEYGDLVWEKTYGGSNNDAFRNIVATPTDEFWLSGYTESDGCGINSHGAADVWLLKHSILADDSPPSAPTGFKVINYQSDTLTLGWNSSFDDHGIDYYTLYQDDVEVADHIQDTTYQIIGPFDIKEYNYKIKAVDYSRKQSEASDLLVNFAEYITAVDFRDNLVYEVVAYPNPFSTHFELKVPLNLKPEPTGEILEITGKRLSTFTRSTSGDGYAVYDWNKPSEIVTPGVYFYRIKTSEGVLYGRIIKSGK